MVTTTTLGVGFTSASNPGTKRNNVISRDTNRRRGSMDKRIILGAEVLARLDGFRDCASLNDREGPSPATALLRGCNLGGGSVWAGTSAAITPRPSSAR